MWQAEHGTIKYTGYAKWNGYSEMNYNAKGKLSFVYDIKYNKLGTTTKLYCEDE